MPNNKSTLYLLLMGGIPVITLVLTLILVMLLTNAEVGMNELPIMVLLALIVGGTLVAALVGVSKVHRATTEHIERMKMIETGNEIKLNSNEQKLGHFTAGLLFSAVGLGLMLEYLLILPRDFIFALTILLVGVAFIVIHFYARRKTPRKRSEDT